MTVTQAIAAASAQMQNQAGGVEAEEDTEAVTLDQCIAALAGVVLDGNGQKAPSYDQLTFVVLVIPPVIGRHLNLKGGVTGPLKRLVKAFCSKTAALLEEPNVLGDALLAALMRAVGSRPEIFQEAPQVRKGVTTSLANIWASHPSDETRVVAFLAIHGICSRYQASLLDVALKTMYQLYVKSCKSLSGHNFGQAGLLMNGLVELYAINGSKALPFAIKFLRQMAASMCEAIKQPLKSKTALVLSWPFIARLRFFSALATYERAAPGAVASGKPKKAVRPFAVLIPPLCTVVSSTLTFQVASRYYPFHFHVISMAMALTRDTGATLPTASALLRIAHHAVRQPFHKLAVKKAAYDFVTLIKVPRSETLTKGYAEGVADEAIFYLMQLLANAAASPLFPEVAAPIVKGLSEAVASKDGKVNRTIKKQIEGHLSKVTHHQRAIERLRIEENLTPIRAAQVDIFALVSKKIAASANGATLSAFMEYFGNLEHVREVRRRLLANKLTELDGADETSSRKRKRDSEKGQKDESSSDDASSDSEAEDAGEIDSEEEEDAGEMDSDEEEVARPAAKRGARLDRKQKSAKAVEMDSDEEEINARPALKRSAKPGQKQKGAQAVAAGRSKKGKASVSQKKGAATKKKRPLPREDDAVLDARGDTIEDFIA